MMNPAVIFVVCIIVLGVALLALAIGASMAQRANRQDSPPPARSRLRMQSQTLNRAAQYTIKIRR